VLALDAAGSACSAALWCEGEIQASRFEAMRRGQSERLMPMIEAVMAEGRLAYADLDLLAVTRGPGGFTGVRIGLATARALALAAARPLLGVSNFEVIAAATSREERNRGPLAVLLDAKRAELFLQVFDADLTPLAPPCACLPEDLPAALPEGPWALAGDGLEAALPALAERDPSPTIAAARQTDARVLACLAARRGPPPRSDDRAQPLYLRAPDVTFPTTRS